MITFQELEDGYSGLMIDNEEETRILNQLSLKRSLHQMDLSGVKSFSTYASTISDENISTLSILQDSSLDINTCNNVFFLNEYLITNLAYLANMVNYLELSDTDSEGEYIRIISRYVLNNFLDVLRLVINIPDETLYIDLFTMYYEYVKEYIVNSLDILSSTKHVVNITNMMLNTGNGLSVFNTASDISLYLDMNQDRHFAYLKSSKYLRYRNSVLGSLYLVYEIIHGKE